jgi:hypothetical protein
LYRFSKCSCSCLESLEKSGGHIFFKREGLGIDDDALGAVAAFVVVAFPAACAIRRASVGNMVACSRRICWSRPVGTRKRAFDDAVPTSNHDATRKSTLCRTVAGVHHPVAHSRAHATGVLIVVVYPTMQDAQAWNPACVPLHQTGGTTHSVRIECVCQIGPQNLRRTL